MATADSPRPPRRPRLTQRQWLAAGCLVIGGWLLAVSMYYVDILGFALALITLMYGVVYIRPPR